MVIGEGWRLGIRDWKMENGELNWRQGIPNSKIRIPNTYPL
jgi:hypothetical protein